MRDLEAAATEPVHLLAERPSSAAGRHQTLMANDVLGFPESASVPNVATVTQTSSEMGMTSSLTPPGKPAHGRSYSAIGELVRRCQRLLRDLKAAATEPVFTELASTFWRSARHPPPAAALR